MNIQETIQYLNDKIAEIETYADMRTHDMPEETKERIAIIANRSITVIQQVVAKVEGASRTTQDANFEGFLQDVVTKCDDAVAYTRRKIDEAVSETEDDDSLKELRQHITSAINDLKNSEEVKDMAASIKEVTTSIYEQVEDFMTRPETKEAMTKAKVSVVKIAEKGVSVLKNVLNVSDEDL